MINESFEIIELHAFARKCQYTDQVLRDVNNKSRYRESGAVETSASDSEKTNLLVSQSNNHSDESFRQQILVSTFDQIFRVIIVSSQAHTSISDQINAFICYNCEKQNHMIKYCRSLLNSRIQKITEKIENEIEINSRKD
jgi:hypothetical protein